MCRFFQSAEKIAIKAFSLALIVAPVIIGLILYNRQAAEDSKVCFYMALWSIPSILSGYFLRDQKKCLLPHLAENVVVHEQEQQPGEFDMAAHAQVPPRIGEP